MLQPFSFSRRPTLWAIGLALLVLLADYFTGPALQFPVFYILPVMLAAWYRGLPLALGLAVVMPLARIYFKYLWNDPDLELHPFLNTASRMSVLVLVAFLTDRVARQLRQLTREVQQLTGLLPICAFCKKIRTEDDQWIQIERYVSERSEAEFSHGYCPECLEKHFGEFLRRRKSEQEKDSR